MLTVGRVGAGTGCKYLTSQVAAGKDDFAELSPARALTYYSEVDPHGESPGRWVGRGLPTLGLAGAVQPEELENLVGKARHPHYDQLLQRRAVALLDDRELAPRERVAAMAAAEKSLYLGRQFAIYESAADRAARAVADLGEDADEASKDAVRAQVLAEGDRQAVAAYELTFTPVKSVSVLAASGGETVWQQVLDAHRDAVDTALDYVQEHASFSRAGVNGVRQIDTDGLVIACFEHRMSREQDPNIHTHSIVANRVLCADGKWRTVDGRAVYAASVGARAVYEQALESELAARLGVRFSLDERKTVREVHGIPAKVIELFSKRRTAIEEKLTNAVTHSAPHDPDNNPEPGERARLSTGGWRTLARRFTLSSRTDKTGTEATIDAITRWQHELAAAGHDPAQLAEAALAPARRDIQPRTDAQLVAAALQVLNQTRAVWTRHHAVLAVSRCYPPAADTSFADHQQHVERLVTALLADSVQVTPPDLLDVGATLRRASDAQSQYTRHADVLYASRSTVAAEQRILTALDDTGAPRMSATDLAAQIARVPLGDDQDAAVHQALTSGARISAIVGPAGSGKTYVQRAIATAWRNRPTPDTPTAAAITLGAQTPMATDPADAGYRQVLALAPSQIAASVLAEAIGARAENVAKWLHEHQRETKRVAQAAKRHTTVAADPAWTLHPGQLVILDEAGMVTTRDLDAILTAVRKAGAKLLLVGDDKQLGAIGAGGMFATLVERTGAPVLSTVRRFRDEQGQLRGWECTASLGLRNRDLDALAEYERRGRIHGGPAARMEQTSYRAWLSDHLALQDGDGHPTGVALLMADTESAAAALSARARQDLVSRGLVEQAGVLLADGNRAGVGDLVVTRLNERTLRAEVGEAFVANRDTWRVTGRGRDGSLTVVSVTTVAPDDEHHADAGTGPRELRLPAAYVAANVQLAYAGTIHSTQGRTVTTARGLVTEATSAEALYVMMSRGQRSNDIYVVTDDTDREAHQRWPEAHHMAVLAGILDREDTPSASVADVERDLYDEASSLQRLRVIFGDLSTVVRGAAYQQIIAEHAGAEAADRAATDPAWSTLVRALGTAHLLGWDSRALLIQAITQRELGTAADAAAVLHWRCQAITGDWQEAPDHRTGSDGHTVALSWADRTAGILTAARSGSHTDPVTADAASALTQVAAAMDQRVDALAERLADQATAGQHGGYDNHTVPAWIATLGPIPTVTDHTPPRQRAIAHTRREAWLALARAVVTYQDAVGHDPADTAASPVVDGPLSSSGIDTDPDQDAAHADTGPHAITDPDPIGARPPAGDAEAGELWATARRALADQAMAGSMRAFDAAQLTAWVSEGLRLETHEQPGYVGHELRALSLRSRAQRTRVHRVQQEVTTAAGLLTTAERRRRWRRNETAIESLRRNHDRATGRLDRALATLADIERDLRAVVEMHQSWQAWEQATREQRQRARLATQELSLRGIDPPPPPPPSTRGQESSLDPSADPTATRASDEVSRYGSPAALDQGVSTPHTAQPAGRPTTLPGFPLAAPQLTSPRLRAEQYALLANAAAWFRANYLGASGPTAARWAPAYLTGRGLAEAADATRVGYSPSRPGHWTLLTDHLRGLGYSDTAIETSGLAVRSRHGLIDRFRDRVVLPVLDEQNRPVGFVGRKPAGDTDERNPKYLNPTGTPLYDKSRILYGLDADAIQRLHAGARAVIVEGPMDRLAIQAAAATLSDNSVSDLVPLATCGTALTDAHLDQLAQHTDLREVMLGFDADAAGRKATLAAGKKLVSRGVPAAAVTLLALPAGDDAAAILQRDGAAGLGDRLVDPAHRDTLLGALIDEQLDHYDWSHSRTLRELPIAEHAAHEAIRLLADQLREQMLWDQPDANLLQQNLRRITERTGADQQQLNAYLIEQVFPTPTDDFSDLHRDQTAETEPDLRDLAPPDDAMSFDSL